jgi:hypothetical protein
MAEDYNCQNPLISTGECGDQFVVNKENLTATVPSSFTSTVSISGNTTMASNASVGGNVTVAGNSSVSGNATVSGNVTSPGVGTFTTQVVSNLGTFQNVSAPFKLFDIPHPSKENQRLRHGCLEGPELAVYARGKTSEGIIPLPDYWENLVDETSITVQLTPTNMDQTLVVNNINRLSIQVLGNNRMPYHYFVMAERKDVEKLEVETNA